MARLKYYNSETNRWEYVDTSKTKTLYQCAVDEGFDGTEEEFAKKLSTSDHAISSVTLISNNWVDNGDETYSQSVNIINGISTSKIELNPDSTALLQLINDGVASLRIDNNNGVFTAIALKAKPTTDLTMQITLTNIM